MSDKNLKIVIQYTELQPEEFESWEEVFENVLDEADVSEKELATEFIKDTFTGASIEDVQDSDLVNLEINLVEPSEAGENDD